MLSVIKHHNHNTPTHVCLHVIPYDGHLAWSTRVVFLDRLLHASSQDSLCAIAESIASDPGGQLEYEDDCQQHGELRGETTISDAVLRLQGATFRSTGVTSNPGKI